MNLAQRFTLLVKGQLNAVLDALEDPERSLNQLVLDMEEELDAAKRTVARAMANEDRMRTRIAFHAEDARRWQQAAERALGKGQEADARAALRQAEVAERQRAKLEEQLANQSAEIAEVRESVARMQDRCIEARSRLELVQARMRQLEARRAAGKVLGLVDAHGLHSEFDRISARVEEASATERNYRKLDDQLTGGDLRRRLEEDAVADAVEERLAQLKAGKEGAGAPGEGPARNEPEAAPPPPQAPEESGR